MKTLMVLALFGSLIVGPFFLLPEASKGSATAWCNDTAIILNTNLSKKELHHQLNTMIKLCKK